MPFSCPLFFFQKTICWRQAVLRVLFQLVAALRVPMSPLPGSSQIRTPEISPLLNIFSLDNDCCRSNLLVHSGGVYVSIGDDRSNNGEMFRQLGQYFMRREGPLLEGQGCQWWS